MPYVGYNLYDDGKVGAHAEVYHHPEYIFSFFRGMEVFSDCNANNNSLLFFNDYWKHYDYPTGTNNSSTAIDLVLGTGTIKVGDPIDPI